MTDTFNREHAGSLFVPRADSYESTRFGLTHIVVMCEIATEDALDPMLVGKR